MDHYGLPQPVFLVGTMRSGTTLAANLIGRMQGVAYCPFELKQVWAKAGVPMPTFQQRGRHCSPMGAGDAEPVMAERLAEGFKAELQKHPDYGEGTKIFLNKNPHLCNKLPYVQALFPSAQFIWIHRSAPHVVASLRKLFEDTNKSNRVWFYWPKRELGQGQAHCWDVYYDRKPLLLDRRRLFPGGDLRFLGEYWLESCRAVHQFFADLPESKGCRLQMLDFITDPAASLARCHDFLKLPPEDLSWAAGTTDPNRNQLSAVRMDAKDKKTLAGFLSERAEQIESMLPGATEAMLAEIQN